MAGTAIFDLDRTLTRRPTWLRFVWRLNRSRPLFWLQIPWLLANAVAHKLGLIDRTAIKDRFMATFSWADRDTVEAAGRMFAAKEVTQGLRASVGALIAEHRKAGDRVYLATAASDFIAHPIANALSLDGAICTQTAWTGSPPRGARVEGRNCYGEEKLMYVRAAIENGTFPGPVTVYSDHVSDLQLLQLADHGIAANPSRKLREEAIRLGLPIIDLDRMPDADATGSMTQERT